MQFSGRIRKKLRLAGDQRNASYPHSLQFYLQPPTENISLTEFENLAFDRVKCKWHLKSNVCVLEKCSYHTMNKGSSSLFSSPFNIRW
jgi:hypothetical protein